MEAFEVAAVPGNMVDNWCQFIRNEADNPENVILRVKAVEKESYSFLLEKQKVEIENVFQQGNSSVNQGEQCYICRGANCLMYSADGKSNSYANWGFVNNMTVGQEYLVIMQYEVEKLDKNETPTLITDFSFFPVFSYTDSESYQINSFSEFDSLWVPYKGLENNEFFVSSDEVYEKLMQMKHDLIAKFPAE